MRISDWSSDVCSSDLHCDGGSDGGDGFIKWNETNGSAFDSRSRCTSLFSQRLERGTDRPNRMPKLRLLSSSCYRPNPRSPKASHRSEEHTSELKSLMRYSYAVLCLKKKKHTQKRKN